jgi:serine/threonine-protein phosphatase 2B catalytic subunit
MDRVHKDVVAPPVYDLTLKDAWDEKKNAPKIEVLRAHLVREGRLDLPLALKILSTAQTVFKAEKNILDISYPVTVCGDVHGQFFDLVRLFAVGGDPGNTKYLFLGDYVDRGCFSTECVFYLCALKIIYPSTLWMLRGNHECRQLTAFFNFKDECVYKYNEELYDAMMNTFDTLPLCALVNKTFFCVHGGLSPSVQTLDDIKGIDRFQEIPREGKMCDLLWSDPYEEDDGGDKDDEEAQQTPTTLFAHNETRQCSYVFGIDAVKKFLKQNKLTSVIRAHEAQADGYKMHMLNKQSGIPRVITIFSAPNYCDVYGNKAACLKFDTNVLNIKQFIDSPHPYYLPNFMDVFQWSMPFVAEKVTDMLHSVMEYEDGDDEDEEAKEGNEEASAALQAKAPRLKEKVKAVSKLLKMYKVLRIESEAIVQLKQLTPNHKVPMGLLSKGSAAIQDALKDFQSARAADAQNERMPRESAAIKGAKYQAFGAGPKLG